MLAPRWICVLILVGGFGFERPTHAARILMLPLNTGSHLMYFNKFTQELLNKGHEVHMLLPPNAVMPFEVKGDNFKVVTYQVKEKELFTDLPPDALKEWQSRLGTTRMSMIDAARYFSPYCMQICRNVLSDDQLYKQLQQNKYDLAMLDGIQFIRCFNVLLYRLGIDYIALTTQYDPWAMRIPTVPSFLPFPQSTAYSEKMNFWERIHNLYTYLDWYLFPGVENMEDKLVSTYAPEKQFVSMSYLVSNSVLWFVNTDNAIDYARPTMPNTISIGGLTTGPPKPLPSDLESFVDQAEHGIIYVSFGTFALQLPEFLLEILMDTFRQLKQNILWKYEPSYLKDIPQNVKCLSWVPQNDILGHQKTLLLIGHGGNNGQFEALYNGVPMINIPLFAEQMYNGKRMEHKGYGRMVWLADLTTERLLVEIHLVLNDVSFKTNIQRGSEIYKSAPMTPLQRGIYWIEHVLQFGAKHLQSHSIHLPWYQYYMVDIFAFLFVLLGIFLFTLAIIFRVVLSIFSKQKQKSKHE